MTPIAILLVAACMAFVETAHARTPWPRVAGWWARAGAVNAFAALLVLSAGARWNQWVLHHRLWSAETLGPLAGGLVGYLALTFLYYWWHRARHASPLLWRWMHQLHHSPQRIEIATCYYKHPIELLVNAALSSVVLFVGLGLSPKAAAFTVFLTGTVELFYHWNVRTPRWIGYVVQRPESHCIHHEEGVHACNYSDLPLWDIVFGTFANPERWEGRCGLGAANELRMREMLAGVDVTAASR